MSSLPKAGLSPRAPLLFAATIPVITGVLWLNTGVKLPAHEGFMPVFLSVVLASHLLISTMLVEHYRAGGGPRLLALSAAYVWSEICIVAHGVTFPGIVTDEGLRLGGNESTSPWLWVGWNVGFPLLVAGALAPWPARVRRWFDQQEHRTVRTFQVHAATVVAALLFVLLCTRGIELLPDMMHDGNYSQFAHDHGLWLFVLPLLALVVSVISVAQRGDRGGLESWAVIAVVATCGDCFLVLTSEERYTVGWYSARGLALTGAFVVLMAMLREVTFLYGQLKETAVLLHKRNDDLVEAQRLSEHLAAVVSHDMRTPLTGLEGYLEVLADPDLPPEHAARMVQRSRVLAKRLTLMTEDLLAVATAGNGSLSLLFTEVDAAAALAECAAAFPDLDVRIDAEPGLWMRADALRLQQVLTNLVRNAQHYGAPPVRLGARPLPHGEVELRVSDAGNGVPEEFVPRLFDAYTRVEGNRHHGSGLGLSVVRDLVDDQDGRVCYVREDNSFRIALPAATTSEDARPPQGPLEPTDPLDDGDGVDGVLVSD